MRASKSGGILGHMDTGTHEDTITTEPVLFSNDISTPNHGPHGREKIVSAGSVWACL